jgi:uncharacterized protein YcbK (DUF882 family)
MISLASVDSLSNTEATSSTASSARSKHGADEFSASGANAFAATLATMMTPTAVDATPTRDDDGANSELDARTNTAAEPDAGLNTGADAGAANSGLGLAPVGLAPNGISSSAVAATREQPLLSQANEKAVSSIATATAHRKPAFAAAEAARAAVAMRPVGQPNSDADSLNPDFRARFGRVVARMHDEFGRDVQLVEGFRTQSRQNFLYEQGRTRPGQVVTWTKSSKHTMGLAADVTIDGSYSNPVAFQQLAQIAAQEGLRTLGARDPGHVELPTHGGAAAWGDFTPTAHIDDNLSRAIGMALDQSNLVGNKSGDDDSVDNFNGLLSRVGRGSGMSTQRIQMPGMSGAGGGMMGNMAQRDYGESRKDTVKSTDPAQTASVAEVATVAQVAQVAHVAQVGNVMPVQPFMSGAPMIHAAGIANGSEAADRVGKLLDARDAAPAQPLSHVTLNVDNAAGGSDRITVQLRGGAVDTAISLGDPNRADRMSLRVGELQHALEQHGLDASAISVASTASSSGPGWNPRQGSDQSDQNGRASLNHRDNRQEADDTRQRSRREQQGGRQK